MKKLKLFLLFSILAGCQEKKNEVTISQPIVMSGSGAYFTTDHLGNPVLCWTSGEVSKQ